MEEKNDVLELDIKGLIGFLLQKSWVVVLSAILVAGMALGYAKFFVTPQYSASIRLYTNNIYEESKGEIQAGQLTAAAYLAEAYIIILEGKPVLNEVLKVTNLQDKYTTAQLHDMVTATAINQTEIFQVTVTSDDSKEAAVIANAFAEVLPKKLPDVVEGSDVRLVDYAVENKTVISPEYKKVMILGALAGVLLSLVALLLREFLDDSIDSEEYLTTIYEEIPLLAVIPDAQEPKGKKYRKYKNYYKRYYRSYYNSGKKTANGGKQV